MVKLRSVVVVLGSFASVLAIACGGSDNSEFGNGQNGDPSKDPNNGGNTSFDDGGAGGPGGGLGGLAACATSSANGQLTPVNLVFMFDRSGSMGDPNDPQSAPLKPVKWDPVVAAMGKFFNDPASAGMSASLQYFAFDQNAGNPKGNSADCQVANYQNPAVAMTALPSAQFATSLNGNSPQGGTPTHPAIQGAIGYAKQIQTQKPGEAAVVVLVTDGEPNDCSSTVQNVSSEAANALAQSKIKTFVIGVGTTQTDTNNLNTIAAAGGTTQAIAVNVSDANGTNAAFQAALTQIRGSVGTGCSFPLPSPPAGQVLDINKVNVVYTPGGGQPQTLTYDPNCAGGKGWHYDSLPSPKSIELCSNTCNDVKTSAGGKVAIAFGCSTQGGVR